MRQTEVIRIGEAAARAGISVRTLRHYDAIGLLSPSTVTVAGYRLYDEAAMARLEQILYFKELGFALDEIREIMINPSYDAAAAMRGQRGLLIKQRERLDILIKRLDEALRGEETPNLEVFSMKEIEMLKEEYAQEAKRRWGDTDAYRESAARTKAYKKDDWNRIQEGMTDLMREFAAMRELAAGDARVQALVERWQQYITDHFYTCTDEILAGLGQMYTADERFKASIDACGEGTAALMSAAIEAYLSKR